MKRWNKFFYRNPKGSIDGDSAWKQQNEQFKHNEIYKMVDMAGGGTFIKEYDEGKTPEEKKSQIQKYFKEHIAPKYLYKGVERITKDDYQSWHNRQTFFAKKLMEGKESHTNVFESNINVNTIDMDIQDDSFSVVTLDTVIAPYTDHEAKWRLKQRGAAGETPIHLLFLKGDQKHIEIAKSLLEIYPELAMDLYEGFEYYGESCLHFAIIQNNFEAVKILLETKMADVHARARGKFFIPVDIKRGDVKLRKRKFEGYAYYGEFPLSFAASIGNHKIYDLLINAGCDPTRRDRYGNNVLHLTVIHNQPDMYYYALKHSVAKADPNVCNNDKLTPLSLAAKLGHKEMFRKILDISSRQYWSYNTVTCSAFPLKSLDSIGPDGDTDWNSALMMIIRGKKDNHLDMVSDYVVHQLLDEKWKKFGKNKFVRLLLAYVFHFLFLTVAIYLRPNDQLYLRDGRSSSDIARYVFESLVTLINMFVIFYTIREVFLESFRGYFLNMTSIPSRLLYLVSVVLMLVCVPIRFLGLYFVEDWLLTFAVPGLWSYLLFFLRNSSLTGPFITMIFKIVATDLARFAFIYVIIIFTSSVAFFYQFEGQNVFVFLSELGTAMSLFQMSFGEFDYSDILMGKYQALSILLFIVFMMLVHILLLNMLIAMITRSFEKITNRSEKVWRQQWASMVVTMERSHSRADKRRFQDSYDLNINATRVTSEGEADRTEAKPVAHDDRALMVVHHQDKSESQRRQHTKNKWKDLTSKAKQTSVEVSTPEPKLQIKSISALADFVKDVADDSDEEDNTILGRIKSAVSEHRDPNRIHYSDTDDDDENI